MSPEAAATFCQQYRYVKKIHNSGFLPNLLNIVRFPCLYGQGLQALLCMRIKCHQHALYKLAKSML
jgi:hypothetical protein